MQLHGAQGFLNLNSGKGKGDRANGGGGGPTPLPPVPALISIKPTRIRGRWSLIIGTSVLK